MLALPRGERGAATRRAARARARSASGPSGPRRAPSSCESSIRMAMRFGSRATWRSSTAGSRNTTSARDRRRGAQPDHRRAPPRRSAAARAPRQARRSRRPRRAPSARPSRPHGASITQRYSLKSVGARRGEPHGQRDQRLAGERAAREQRTPTPSSAAGHASAAARSRDRDRARARGASAATRERDRAQREQRDVHCPALGRRGSAPSSGFQRRRFMMNGTWTWSAL